MAKTTGKYETVKEGYKEQELAVTNSIKLTDAQRFTVFRDGTIGGTKRGDTFFGDAKTGTTYLGGEGDDTLLSSPGGVHFDGGAGSDWVDYSASRAGVTVDLEAGLGQRGDAKGDSYTDVENVRGSQYDDVLTDNEAANTIEGGAGNDTIILASGTSQANEDTINGGTGFDTVDASGFSRAIYVNIVDGTGALREIFEEHGGLMNIRAQFESIEAIIGSSYDDTVEVNSGNFSFSSGLGNDTLIVNTHAAFSFFGGGGWDTLDMGAANHDVSYDFSAGELQDFETGEKLGGLTYIEELIASKGDNVIINGGRLKTVHGEHGNDTFITNDLDFTLFNGGHPSGIGQLRDIDTISFENAQGAIGYTGPYELSANSLNGKVQNVEKIIGTEFDDEMPRNFYKQFGGGGNDTFTFDEAFVNAIPTGEGEGWSDPGFVAEVELDGGEGVDTLKVLDADGGIIDLQTGNATLHGQDAEIRDIENLQVLRSDVTIIGDDGDTRIELASFYAYEVDGEEHFHSTNAASSAIVSGGDGDDTVVMNYDRNASSSGTQSLQFDGGEGFDTLSYAVTETNLLSQESHSDIGLEAWASGVEINVENGTVQERREGDAGVTHTFQNVESFKGSNIADRFIDGEGSQTYEGVSFPDGYVSFEDLSLAVAQDTFVFSNDASDNGDEDTILDFTAGEDLIDLSGTNRNSWDEILDGNWEQVGNDTVLDIGFGHDLVLKDVQFSSLSDTDFIF